MLFPTGILEYLGLPSVDNHFYPTILGGVIFGIGIALVIELLGAPKGIRGLGLGGAIVINLCGGGILLIWLLIGNLNIPIRGVALLWIVAIRVLGIGFAEIFTKSWQ